MHSPPRRLLGEKVRELRVARGQYHRQFALSAQVNWRYLYDIQSGKKQPSEVIIARLANALGVSPEEITEPVSDEPDRVSA